MSADNGIYILKTKDQYRVIHAQAIENLWWSYIENTTQRDIVPTRIVEYYGNVRYTRDETKAQSVAFAMAKSRPILEYGIQVIEVNKTWKQIVREAKGLAALEIEVVKMKGDKWKWELEQLEKVMKYKN